MCGFHIYKSAYSLKFICNPKSILVFWQVIYKHTKKGKIFKVSAVCVHSWSGTKYHSSVFFHLLDRKHISFVPSIQCCFFAFFCSLLVTFLFRKVPKHRNEELPSVSHHKTIFTAENICDKLRLGMSYVVLLAISSTLMNKWYLVNKVSLNRNIHKTELRIGCLTNVMTRGSQEPTHCIFPSSNGSAFTATL